MPPLFQVRLSMKTLLTLLQIDYHGLAKALGLKDNKSATSTWCTVKKKLGIQPATPTEAKPKTPSKPKEAKATTTPKSSKKVTSAPAATEVDGDETDEIDGGSSATDLKHESEEGEVDAQGKPNPNGAQQRPTFSY